MLKIILERIALGVLTLLTVSILVFSATEILPGDVASAVLGQGATPEALATYRKDLGLDLPATTRYVQWLSGAVQGDFGVSLTNGRSIDEEVAPRFRNTMFLAAFAALLAVPLAVGLGIVSAVYEDRLVDRASNVLSLITISVPEFFLAYLLILLLSVYGGWFPSLATVFSDMGLGQRLYVTVLPAVTLTLLVTAHMLRMTRATVLAVMSQPYIEMAFLKGLSRWHVVLKHALPNAAGPIINVVALNIAYLIVGVVVIEVVFVYPGIGQLMVDAVSKRDIPVVQATGLIFAAVFVVLNTIADVLVILLDPHLRSAQ